MIVKQLEGLPMDDAIVGIATELVNYPQRLAPIIHRLLGDFLVVSSIDKLFHLPQKIRESYNLVTF